MELTANDYTVRVNPANKSLYVGVSYAIKSADGFTTESYGILYCNDGTITDASELTLEPAKTNPSIQNIAGKTGTNLLDTGKGVAAVGYAVVKNSAGQEAVVYTGNIGGSYAELSN